MKFHGTLTTLAPLTKEHIPACWKWISDKKVTHHMGGPFAKTYRQELKWLRNLLKKKDEKIFAILEKETSKHIGNLGIHGINKDHKRATVGIVIGEKNYWSHGFGTDALKTALKYCFNKLKLQKIQLDVSTDHEAAQKCYKKAGFKRVGTMKNHYQKNGKFYDAYLMEALA